MKQSVFVTILITILTLELSPQQAQGSSRYQPTDKMRMETRYVIQNMEQIHYTNKPITEIDAQEFIKNYATEFDPNHLFFLQSDIDHFIERFADPMSFYLRQGNLFPAFEIFDIYQARAEKRFNWVFEQLKTPIDITQDGYYTPDRKDLPWPSDAKAADKLWKQRLKFELLNEVLSDNIEEAALCTPPACWNTLNDFIFSYYNRVEKRRTIPELLYNIGGAIEDAENTYYVLAHPSAMEPEEKSFDEQVEEGVLNLKKRYKRLQKMITDIEPFEVQEIFLTTLTQMYDPHSTFLSADSMEEFTIAMHNSLVGIGAVLAEEDGICTIKELMPGGPAEKSKQLDPNDKIVGVAQGNGAMVDIMGLKLRKIVKLIRGKKGTQVRLLIWPAGTDPSKRKTVTLIRDEIKLTSNLAEARLFDIPINGEHTKIGVIDLPTFYGSGDPRSDDPSTTRNVEELITKLKQAGMQGLILDLRRNGGGLLLEAINLTGLFIPTGPVVQVKDTLGQLNEYADQNPKMAWDGPLIILVSRYSASASEIVAGALKSHNRAIIVGDEATHGKGTVQVIFQIDRSILARLTQPKMGAAKITVQKWYLPNGNSTQLRGVESDIILPSVNTYLPIGESDLPHALEWDAIHALPWTVDDLGLFTPDTKNLLTAKSLDRQASLEEFSYLKENIDWFKKKRDQKVFSLNYHEREIQKNLDEHFQEERDVTLKKLSDQAYTSQDILLDIALEKELPKKKADDNKPNFDIHLREALRIMADWLYILDESNKKILAETALNAA
ncbi:MAG TPA: tail-specific protease [Opitutae bacterium]|nr:tail-specific protease [Opitutae bacterium]|tara:strand:+ start:2876 stop:5212 length:2337 start_codon:yes stop_codon:yes gene_type:complete